MLIAMTSQWTTMPVSFDSFVPEPGERNVIEGVDWDKYEALLALRGHRSRPKLAYLDGAVEIMSTTREHERLKSAIGRLVEAYCLERDVDFSAYGSWTLKRQLKRAGAEADECYIFARHPENQALPDLAIEVVWTSGGLDKLEIYRRLQVGEVWFWKQGSLQVHVLGPHPRGYVPRDRSVCLPDLDLALLCRLAQVEPMSDAIKQLRAALCS
jgi:Uma2 family endonuclease